jgi:hypothetical protein
MKIFDRHFGLRSTNACVSVFHVARGLSADGLASARIRDPFVVLFRINCVNAKSAWTAS